jgi:hypothetical protein
VKASVLGQHDRWDYGFHEARLNLETAAQSSPALGWRRVGETVTMRRGGLSSPEGKRSGVHTCDFRGGIWHIDRAELQPRPDRYSLRTSDLLIKRVGRACSQSTGIVLRQTSVGATDCVLILRPKRSGEEFATLFGLRAVLGASSGASLVEQGTGASYIAEDSLSGLQIPMNIKNVYPSLYDRYVACTEVGDGEGILKLEAELRKRLGL